MRVDHGGGVHGCAQDMNVVDDGGDTVVEGFEAAGEGADTSLGWSDVGRLEGHHFD